jgi:hypothetical protein
MRGRRVRLVVSGVLVLSLLATACGSGDLAGNDDSATGDDLSAFCASWQELAALVATEPDPSAETFSALFELVDDVEPVLPADLVIEWEAFVGFNRTFRDLLVTVGYELERVDDDLIARAFGDAQAADTQSAASEAAFESVESWAAAGCGDFCARWPELRQALDELGGWLEWARRPEETDHRLARFERTLALGSELAPDGMRSDWDLAVTVRTDWVRWWGSFGFDPQAFQLDEAEFVGTAPAQLALEIVRSADYFSLEHLSDFILNDPSTNQIRQEAWMAWQSGSELPEGWDLPNVEAELLWIFQFGPTDRHRPVDNRLQEWVTQNCETAGSPGRLIVGFNEGIADAPGSSLVVALVRKGGSVTDLVDPKRLVGSLCERIGRNPWEPFWRDPNGDVEYQTWALNAEPGENQESPGLCWHGDQRVFAGGDYTLVVAVFHGGLERSDTREGLPPPTLCLEQGVQIAGDTEVLLASPGPCDIGDWPAGAAEDPWRNPPPVDADAPGAGTLKVVVPSLMADLVVPSLTQEADDTDGARLSIVTLPIGTTLNELGREEVWPLSVVCVDLPPSSHVGQEVRRQFERSASLPIGPVPLLGAPVCLEAWWLVEDPPDDRLPVALLPPGAVTVLASIEYFTRDGQSETSFCASFDVVIKGDTVVDIPEWGECPT